MVDAGRAVERSAKKDRYHFPRTNRDALAEVRPNIQCIRGGRSGSMHHVHEKGRRRILKHTALRTGATHERSASPIAPIRVTCWRISPHVQVQIAGEIGELELDSGHARADREEVGARLTGL